MRCLTILFFLISGWWVLSAQQPIWQPHPLPEPYKGAAASVLTATSDGFVWLGTDRGLFRFDGLNFRHYTLQDTLEVRQVTALWEGSGQRLWIGYKNGTIAFIDSNGAISSWEIEEGHPVVPITGFAEDQDGHLWIATYGEGVYCYRNDILYNFDEEDHLLGEDIYDLVSDSSGRIWVGTDRGISICRMRGFEKKVQNLTTSDGLPDAIVRDLYPDGNQGMWIGTHEKGVCRYDFEQETFTRLVADWTFGQVNSIQPIDQRELWIGTEKHGVFRLAFESKSLQPMSHTRASRQPQVRDLFYGQEGLIWVANGSGGLGSFYRPFEYVQPPFGQIQCLERGGGDSLWVGTQQGVWLACRDTTGSLSFREVLSGMNVISLFWDERDHLWIGTFGEGLLQLDPMEKKKKLFTEENGLSNNSILSIDGIDDKLWLATLGGVTEIQVPSGGNWNEKPRIQTFGRESGLGTNFIYQVFLDSRGRCWFATDGKGVAVLDNGEIEVFPRSGNEEFEAVYSLVEDWRGHIWFSTADNGLFEFDGQRFVHFGLEDGLRDRDVLGLINDENGNLLIIHPTGIDLLDPATRHIMYFDEDVGIPESTPNINVTTRDEGGDTWLGGPDYLLRFSALQQLQIHPKTVLDKVSVFLDPVEYELVSEFKHHENNLVFEYVGLWYTDPEAVEYRYRLEGFDLDWIQTNDRRAVYSNLPPGEYTFQVSSTENGRFSEEPVVAYSFEVMSPFWTRWWFVGLVLAGLGAGAYLLLKIRDQRIQRLALLRREKIESQYEALKSQVNPHFLFNSFNTLIANIEEDPQSAIEYVEKLSDFYRNILAYREKEVIPIEEEIRLVKDYGYLLKKRFGDNLKLEIELEGNSLLVAPLSLQMLVENAIKHNVVSSQKPLHVRIDRQEDYIRVVNNRQEKWTREPSTGFGLQSIANRYKLLIDREVKISEVNGTFEVLLPVIESKST